MENLTRTRNPHRALFMKSYAEVVMELDNEKPDLQLLKTGLELLENKLHHLQEMDNAIFDMMLMDEVSENVLMRETEEAYGFMEKFIGVKNRALDIINDVTMVNQSVYGDAMSNVGSRSQVKLPKLELVKFSGEVKDWLNFWSCFKKIDQDSRLDEEEKFQYLSQSMIKGSRAAELVQSFPPTGANYSEVVKSLKERFGREDLQVEVYVRELLKLVLCNAAGKEKISVVKLYDQLESHMRSLGTLGVTGEKCGTILFPLVESCLPDDLLKAWQRSPMNVIPTGDDDVAKSRLDSMMKFLRSEVEGEERIKLARTGFGLQSKKERKEKEDIPTASSLLVEEKKKVSCIFCQKENHPSTKCFVGKKMDHKDKMACVKKSGVCAACLKHGHLQKSCEMDSKCFSCGEKHYAVMCPKKNDEQVQKKKDDVPLNQAMANVTSSPEVSLQTLVVLLKGKNKSKLARIILDSGSHNSYILKGTAEELGLTSIGNQLLCHSLFGGLRSKEESHSKYVISVRQKNSEYSCKIEVMDQETICGEIPRVVAGEWKDELRQNKIVLSDADSSSPIKIEVLLGADVYGKLLTGNKLELKSGLVAVETKLGWTLMGRLPKVERTSLLSATFLSTQATIQDLWKLEAIGINDPTEDKSREELEDAAKEHFKRTVTRDEEGRYEVHLPWIEGHPELGSNRGIAERRLVTATEKLKTCNKLNAYQNVFNEWEQDGIIEKVKAEEVGNFGHYLPHRAVFKESSNTTKVRPVFDASAKERGRASLNECLEKGPNLIARVPESILRFRLRRIGVSSDITKAFLQMSLKLSDRDFVRFLWWEDLQLKKICVYRHCRVVFGVICSPFLLGAVILHHLEHSPIEFKDIAKRLMDAFYVDNLLDSLSDKHELELYINKSTELMAKGKFDLRAWEYSFDGDGSPDSKVLGLKWNKLEDSLSCSVEELTTMTELVTRRTLLSVTHKLFDPIGFTAPVTILPKLLLQESWSQKAGWDDELSDGVKSKFLKWMKEVMLLSSVRIPRWVQYDEGESKSLHVFSDASMYCYAAAVFLRVETNTGAAIHLIQAKSRVSPLKKTTIPRLELLGCLIGARLVNSIRKIHEMADCPTYYWTDSSTALCWIKREEQWGTFVGNRVKEIRATTSAEQWRHVPGCLNPADLPSRGCSVKQLLESKWWEGPAWLKNDNAEWPNSTFMADENLVTEERKKTVQSLLSVLGNVKDQWYLKFGLNFEKIVRSIAWLIRFRRWIFNRNIEAGSLTVDELSVAERKLIRIVQHEVFERSGGGLLNGIAVFIDQDGLIRVKSRIEKREDSMDFKNPVLLPSTHPLVSSLILHRHELMKHAGVQTVLLDIRNNYWIIRGRKSVRSVLKRCVRCCKVEGKLLKSCPVTLPEDRVRDAAVFEIVGVDLTGPLYLKGGSKCYVVLFTCAVYRAVHLELVTSLTTEGFLEAFRRFIGRRGRPSTVYSDNGRNLVGLRRELLDLDWKKIQNEASLLRIQWKLNPPTAAWWGGWWERLIRILKQLLRKILGRACLTYEELLTIVVDCEWVINSRPLTYLSEDENDLRPLTPACFLKDNKEEGTADLDTVSHMSLNRRCKYRQKLTDLLKKRFRSEYLSQLIQREKQRKDPKIISVGDVVLVGSDLLKRINWPLGVVTEILPGKDGKTRVVRVKTATGEYLRPVQRLVPLEVSSKDDQIVKSV